MERLAYKLLLAYAGRPFAGWQRQPGRASVQETLGGALLRAGLDVSLAAAARTDAGVSARRQVVTFRARCRLDGSIVPALNAALPRGVRVLSLTPAPPSFHARASARWKEYRYRVRVGPPACSGAWSVPDPRSLPRLQLPLDLGAARELLAAQLGRRDRSGFTTRPTGPKETELIAAELRAPNPGRLLFRFVGGSFTRHLVRNWVWAAVARAAGVAADFESPRGWRGPRAPGHGLVLWDVGYDGDPDGS
ncbi:MAG TPA: tRNA pseudouridine(38-40) synthase TruA [Myxococcales bacterium]|nr:tRNA pseudouridine(38-40) synthase TruA [Myxococcales bacterium]